ncbi:MULTISPECIES: hypothetical protein [Atopobiaceae]|uniref:Uncharacterized protein n=1 Tax=Parafannyhessea umbonata TaxID=604330 RepID=A0A1H9N910_9ACTN|nr:MULTISPECIES: hypothetical protein [Atopobiaceae]SEH38968.1 hypothetical protein SAMN05216447_101284 [Parafannyhessea umbonata]SER32301.1 hypothetical protein SAMN05216446_0291 [Parafannyhessea umbonata]SJZ42427.1 hypothetical protein SAMN06298223_0299 [Olsenella sp. KH1P3]
MSSSKEFTPLADAKERVLAYGNSHWRLRCLGAALLVVLMGALLVWFTSLSGFNEPAQFVYAGF